MMLLPHDLIDYALAAARADHTVVIVQSESEAALRWAGNSMTTNGVASTQSWSAVSFHKSAAGVSVGSVTSTSFDKDDVVGVVRASESAAADAPPAKDAMPFLESDGAVAPGWDDSCAVTSIAVFEPLVDDLARGFASAHAVADRLYGFSHHQLRTTWLATSSGIRRRYTEPIGSIEINGKRGSGPIESSAWAGVSTGDFTDVSVPALLSEIDTRLGWATRQVDLPAARYDTILPPSAVADLLIYLVWLMDGRSANEGHSALSKPGGTRVGERLSDLPLTLFSDPDFPGLGYPPFVATTASSDAVSVFDNGMSAKKVDWIADGSVNALAYPRAAAAEFGAPVAVPGENLILTGGTASTTGDLVAKTERGLLLTTLWYIRLVDPASALLTGLTRDGVYLIEDGQITGEVNNFRFNESPLDLLRRVTECGATERTLPREWKDWFTRTAMPPLRIPDFHMSSVSQAR